ncbi:MAG: hypothetical protein ACOYN0_08215 [Phycisphaerales bacterium]
MNHTAIIVITASAAACWGQDTGQLSVGVEARHVYRAAAVLRTKPVAHRQPLLVRIADARPDGDAYLYDLRATAMVPGVHDLRTALERADGGAMDDLPLATIEAVSVLPKAHRGVDPRPDPAPPALGGYRSLAIAAGVVWGVPVLWFAGRAIFRRRRAPVAAQAIAPPTLADQLRPLVEAAIAGTAPVEDRARLERLLLAHWRERLSINAATAREALAVLKAHPEAGAILRAVEHWLHKPRAEGEAGPDISALLAPYRGSPVVGAVQEVELKPVSTRITGSKRGEP